MLEEKIIFGPEINLLNQKCVEMETFLNPTSVF